MVRTSCCLMSRSSPERSCCSLLSSARSCSRCFSTCSIHSNIRTNGISASGQLRVETGNGHVREVRWRWLKGVRTSLKSKCSRTNAWSCNHNTAIQTQTQTSVSTTGNCDRVRDTTRKSRRTEKHHQLSPHDIPLTIFINTCLGGDLLLELFDLVVHDLGLSAHLGDLVLRLDQALAVVVAVRAHRLVQLLLHTHNTGRIYIRVRDTTSAEECNHIQVWRERDCDGNDYLLLEACLDLDDLALQLMDLCTDSTRRRK